MAIFTRILDFKRDFLARLRDKRSNPRYRVGEAFPLKAMLNLVGDDGAARHKSITRGNGRDWGGRVSDLSDAGLSIYLPPAAVTTRGEPSIVRLTLEQHELVIPCTVAHYRVYHSHALCGVKLEFKDFKVQKAYQQLVEAVRLGASFSPTTRGRCKRAPLGAVRRSWRSANKAHLTDWRVSGQPQSNGFELSLGEHSITGNTAHPGLEVQTRSPMTQSSLVEENEVRQLFRWVVANMPKSIPVDLRNLMTKMSAQPPPGAPDPGPAGKWQPPKR